jgi:Na+/proline symporter
MHILTSARTPQKTQSFMSAITLLGTPAEVYQFGTMYWLIVLAFFLVVPATNYLYMPIFYQLQVTSAYEVHPIITAMTTVIICYGFR